MATPDQQLPKAPIVEAILDIDCDLPPDVTIESLEKPARDSFRDAYPKFRIRHELQHHFEVKGDQGHKSSTSQDISGYMFLHEDEKQLVQVRAQGFSFNRLAPYSTLDDYMPEIERTWHSFAEFTKPIKVTRVRLRYINRINLPLGQESLDLDEYLKLGPRLPDEQGLLLKGFLNQYQAIDKQSGHEVKAILTAQKPEQDILPIIFDVTTASGSSLNPKEWGEIMASIQSLRQLKNDIFYKTLEQKCLQLFK